MELIFLSIYPLPAFLTPIPLIPFTKEEITSFTKEANKVANKAPRSPSCCFLFHVFLFQLTPSVNTPKSFNNFMILIISFIF